MNLPMPRVGRTTAWPALWGRADTDFSHVGEQQLAGARPGFKSSRSTVTGSADPLFESRADRSYELFIVMIARLPTKMSEPMHFCFVLFLIATQRDRACKIGC